MPGPEALGLLPVSALSYPSAELIVSPFWVSSETVVCLLHREVGFVNAQARARTRVVLEVPAATGAAALGARFSSVLQLESRCP